MSYEVPGDDFTHAGKASSATKRALKKLGISPAVVRNVAIAMYEGEINMVIHAGGGHIDLSVTPDAVTMVLTDHGPGIPDVEKAMQNGWSTASAEVRSMGFGAGMGLKKKKKYTDEMHIDTEVGRGTTITMTVYLNKA